MKSRWGDRLVGIVVGVAIGLGVLVYFVFVHSEGTIDAPKIDESNSAERVAPTPSPSPARGGPEKAGSRPKEDSGTKATSGAKTDRVPVVEVIGGAPPTEGGPKQLHFKVGEEVRFEIDTEEPFSFEIRGLGIEESIESTSIVSFKAKRAGQFPVIATATLIGVADLTIEKARTGRPLRGR